MDLTTSTKAADEATLDAGKIKLGAAMRRQAASGVALPPASVADSGKIRLGAAMRVPGRRHG